MTPDQRATLAAAVEALQTADDPYSFLYCAADENGEPTLLLAEGAISPMALLGLLRSAKDRSFLRGKASFEDGVVVFVAELSEKPSFAEHLAGPLAEAVPGLAGARVVGEQPAEIDEAIAEMEAELDDEEPAPAAPEDDEDFNASGDLGGDGGEEDDEDFGASGDFGGEAPAPEEDDGDEAEEEPAPEVVVAPRAPPRAPPPRPVTRRAAPAAADPAAAAKRRFDSAEAAVAALEEGMLGRNAAAVLPRHRAAVEALAKAAAAAGVLVPPAEGDTKGPIAALAAHAKTVKTGVGKFKLVARSRDVYELLTLEAPIEPVTALAALGVTDKPRAEAWNHLYDTLFQLTEAHKAVLYQLETWSDRLSEAQLSLLDGNHAALEAVIRDTLDLVLILARPVADR